MKRALPAILALVITVVAFGSAYGINTAIRVFVAPEAGALEAVAGDVGDPRSVARRDDAPRALSESQYLSQILSRNIFDIAFIETYNPKAAGPGGDGMVRTDLKVRLVGTVVATPEVYSSALIAEEGGDYALGYGIGDKIYDAEVVAIAPKRVTLKRGDGSIEELTMQEEAAPKSESDGGEVAEGAPTEGVEQLGENKFAVDRSLLDKYLADPTQLASMGRALLHKGPDGTTDGYRLSAIRRGTLADQLGIKNGDVIHSVNGSPLNSVQSAMGAYQGLSSQSNFSFEVTRRGQKVTLDYQVR